MNVYITTCDDNIFVIKYFQYFFNKYWDENIQVKILGFNPPDFELYKNFHFVSLGNEQKNKAKGWSNYLIDFFSSIDDDFFIFGIDDFMIARPVNQIVFDTCKQLLHEKTGRIDLQCSLQYARKPHQTQYYTNKNNIDFIKMVQVDPYGENLYQNSGAFSIWNRKWFLKNIKRDWSPWDWEVIGSSLANNDGFDVIGSVDKWAIKKLEILSNNAWPGIINTKGIRKEDLLEMEKMRLPSDRIKLFHSVEDDQWGYPILGNKWVDIIYGE